MSNKKRAAPFELKIEDSDDDYLKDVGKTNTPEEIQQRKIIRVKGVKAPQADQPAKKLVINAPLPTFTQQIVPIQSKEESLKLIQQGLSSENLKKQLSPIKELAIEDKKPEDMKTPDINISQNLFALPGSQNTNKLFAPSKDEGFLNILQLPQSSNLSTGFTSPVVFMSKSNASLFSQPQKQVKIEKKASVKQIFCVSSGQVNDTITFTQGQIEIYREESADKVEILIRDQIYTYKGHLIKEDIKNCQSVVERIQFRSFSTEDSQDAVNLIFQTEKESQDFLTELKKVFE